MKTWVRKTLSVGVLAAGALLFAPGAAHADVSQNTWDNNGIVNGTQFVVPMSFPANIVGNSDGLLLGEANAAGVGVNHTEGTRHNQGRKVQQNSHDNNGIANGTQVYVPFYAPLNIVGNADSVLGHSNAAGIGVNGRRTEGGQISDHNRPGHGGQNSWDNNGIANGTQVYAPIDVPVNICGNSFSLLGHSNAAAVCSNGGRWKLEGIRHVGGVQQNSHDNNGIANGTQVYAPITMPVNLAGNSDSFLLGHSNAAAVAHNESGHDGISQDTWDNNGILNGTQIAAPIHRPINICGNALGILGHANAAAACANDGGFGGLHGGNGGHGHHGHGNGHGDNGGDHGGVNGDDDDYLGDNGDDDAYLGDHGDNDGTGDAAGDDGYYGGGSDRTAATEGSPVDGLTQNLGNAGGTAIPGLGLLNTLR